MKQKIVDKLRERYSEIHPLVFQRSLEYAKDETELFDILDTIPKSGIFKWDLAIKRWVEAPLFEPMSDLDF